MKFEHERPDGRNAFTGYGSGYVEVNRQRHTASVVVSGERLVAAWTAVASVEALGPADFAPLLALKPEIVLLGTGPAFDFPHPRVLAPLRDAGIGVEVMDTPAACRTYNILLAEGRNVVAALLVTPGTAAP